MLYTKDYSFYIDMKELVNEYVYDPSMADVCDQIQDPREYTLDELKEHIKRATICFIKYLLNSKYNINKEGMDVDYGIYYHIIEHCYCKDAVDEFKQFLKDNFNYKRVVITDIFTTQNDFVTVTFTSAKDYKADYFVPNNVAIENMEPQPLGIVR